MKRKRQPKAKQPKTKTSVPLNPADGSWSSDSGKATAAAIDAAFAQMKQLSVESRIRLLEERVFASTQEMKSEDDTSISLADHRKAMMDLGIEKDRAFAAEYQKWEKYKESLLKSLDDLRKFKQEVQSALTPNYEE